MHQQNKRPNVIIIIPHDLGDHLNCYGYPAISSPHLDQFAARGIRFTNNFAIAPECTPSRAGMLTGLYTHQTGLMGLGHRGWEFDPDAVHLAQHLQRGGYQTHLFGFQHETGGSPYRLGYMHLHSQEDRNCGPVSRAAVDFLKDTSATEPWFACIGFMQVHRGSGWPEDPSFAAEDVEIPPYLPDTPETRHEFARYYQCIKNMDAAVGEILAAVSAREDAENTLVIFTTDHGIPFPKAKSTCYDTGIRTVMMLQWPTHLAGGKTEDALISNLDLCPTVLEACGVPVPDGLEGRSFLPLLEGMEYQERDAVFGALYYDAAYDPMHYVRTRDYKYIRSFAITPEEAAGADAEVLAKRLTGAYIRADDSDVQKSEAWKAMLHAPVPVQAEELYDLQTDPYEWNNLAEDPASQAALEQLRALMKEMMQRTNSPLLKGHVSPDLSSTRNQVKQRKP